jgi:predicted ATPase
MFRQIDLGNFKRFQRGRLDLRRLNIFVGPNNSGKSSALAALRLICQTIDSYDDQVPLLLKGPFGDFGTFRDLVYRNHRGRPLELAFEVELPSLQSVTGSAELPPSIVSFDVVFKYLQEEREIYAQDIIVKVDGVHFISLKYSKDGRRHNVEKLGHLDVPSALKNALSREFRVRHFVPVPVAGRLGMFSERERNTPYRQFVEQFNTGPSAEIMRQLARLTSRLSNLVSRTDYLGPLRTAPERTYLFSGERSKRIGVGGENMTSILATKDPRRSKDKDDESTSLNGRIDGWLQKAEMAHSARVAAISDRHFEIRVKNFFTREDQNIADVGYGHSQVIPFLAGGYALGPGSVYIAEQPELHLHPRAQSELGDYLLELYEARTQVLVETHSEHLILRLQQHVAAGSIETGDIRIFYICNDIAADAATNGAQADREIIPIDLDSQGQFTRPWPKGFFPEKLDESKKLAKIRMAQLSLKF